MEAFDIGMFDKIGVVGLCVLIVLALIRGWIVPGPWVTSRLKEKDADILRLREANDRQHEQITRLLEVGETTRSVLRAVEGLLDKDGHP